MGMDSKRESEKQVRKGEGSPEPRTGDPVRTGGSIRGSGEEEPPPAVTAEKRRRDTPHHRWTIVRPAHNVVAEGCLSRPELAGSKSP
ncbi:hypothetical protein V501_03521 [Pseudogymnoascus sp. VKM F-4519 (FW-2642)]|nr:hypothetical protein V501_03521 [Pseudogymnoascus sp. VKM F-4519 (FW-2642)]